MSVQAEIVEVETTNRDTLTAEIPNDGRDEEIARAFLHEASERT